MPLVKSTEGTAAIFPGYLQSLQLSFDPFDPADDDFVFYRGAQRGLIVEQLVQMSAFGAGVIVVAGDPGSGRTTLKQQLGDLCYESRRLCEITVDEVTSPEEIFSALAAALDCEVSPGASAGEMMALIRQRLNQWRTPGSNQDNDEPGSVGEWPAPVAPEGQERRESLLLLLDDAPLLGDAVLSALLSLLQSSGGAEELPLHMVLFGDFELVQRLDAIALVDVLLQDLALPLLDIEDLADYLEVKLKAAGWVGSLPFDEAELDQLLVVSGGVPGQVHDAARELLALKSGDEGVASTAVGHTLPVAHIFTLVVLIGVLLMAFFYKDNWLSGTDSAAGSVADAAGRSTSTRHDVDPVPVVAEGARPQRRQESLDVVLKPLAGGAEKPLAGEAERPAAESNDKPLVRAEDKLLVRADEKPLAGGNDPLASGGGPAQQRLTSSVQSGSAAALSTAVAAVPEPLSKEPGAAAGAGEKAPGTPVGQPSKLSSDETFLLSLSPSQYVLQVMAAGSKDAVEAFIERQGNRRELRLFATLRSGQPWFVVVTGVYPTSEAARIGVASLPPEQKKVGPWPRSVSDVHLKIREFHRI
ncbi:AAA family ATPase [Aestuariicella hydrocarbonica]|uniref:AAA family ATPase n=1 Tax=Pseudomaricurvus hydrocarbonicus TaxID=1470433 RepID=A0A9E5MPS8_9GAMM|nr:AAA family ATPase [Aestuariicella hydrocarbonica]NHO68107.1 AAA family ATPase [Aestuariicella hydrocarbonica]